MKERLNTLWTIETVDEVLGGTETFSEMLFVLHRLYLCPVMTVSYRFPRESGFGGFLLSLCCEERQMFA